MHRLIGSNVVAAVWLAAASPVAAQAGASADRIVEVRGYNLKPGTRERFHERFVREALPMLQRWRVDVVAYGPSLHDADSYYLMRAFPSVDERQRVEDAFYGSDEWRKGLRDAVLADIVSYTTVVVRVDASTLRALREALAPQLSGRAVSTGQGAPSDLDALLALNGEYIRSAQTSDAKRFAELLADDFRASLSDGSFVDKAAFLRLAAQPSTVSNLEAHDVEVRLLGDVAIVHARTTFTTADGRPGSGRYTDVWARRGGRWLAVSAHVTRR